MNTYTIERNAEYNSVEVTFEGKPSDAVRDALKALRFRWHGMKKVWYGYKEEETVRAAIDEAEKAEASEPKQRRAKLGDAETAQKVNKFGVRVGDFFEASWGYEQTNADFFQVVALVGECSVRVREVNPPIIEETAGGPMQADRVYDVRNTGKLLPPSPHSVFIKDQERGDLKRLKDYTKDGTCPQFFLASFTDARKCLGNTSKQYESWYY